MDAAYGSDLTGQKGRPSAGAAEDASLALAASSPAYSLEEQQWLLHLARDAIALAVTTGKLPEVLPAAIPQRLTELKACFVTLTVRGRLRGCIGHIHAQEPLYRAVIENARSAALRDSRFAPVQSDELPELHIELSVLTPPLPLLFQSPGELVAKLRPRCDGVVLHVAGRSATFLPQVWDQLPDAVEFLNRLALKAGGPPGGWRGPDVSVATYQVQSFAEKTKPET